MRKLRLGIDLGGTTIWKDGEKINPFPDCIETLAKFSKNHEIFIVSRVNSNQRERSLKWLEEFNFFEKTGIKKDNLYYCFDRRDKAIFAKALELNLFIDDRPNCLSPMPDSVGKILFRPSYHDLTTFSTEIEKMLIVTSWKEIDETFNLMTKIAGAFQESR